MGVGEFRGAPGYCGSSRVAVTGGTGFVGAALMQRLLESGMNVRALSRNRREIHGVSGESTLSAGVEVVDFDLTKALSTGSLEGIETVFHVAALVPDDMEDASYANPCWEANALGTQRLCIAARDAGVSQFILVSSGSAYEASVQPRRESDALFPRHAPYYLTSKVAGEFLAAHVLKGTSTRLSVLRPSAIYGPGMPRTSVLWHFANRLSQGRPVQVLEGGQQESDFVYIDDVVDTCLAVVQASAEGVFNVGSGQSTSILDLALTMVRLLQVPSELIEIQPHTGRNRADFGRLDISKARRVLGLVPTPLDSGLMKLVRSLGE